MRSSILIILFLATAGLSTAKELPLSASSFSIGGNQGYIENKGQIIDQNNTPNPAVKYLLNRSGLNLQLKANSFSYDSYTEKRKTESSQNTNVLSTSLPQKPKQSISRSYHRIDVELIGANPAPVIRTEGSSSDYLNYYTTGLPEQGATNVRSFAKIVYQDIYPHIDLEFFQGKHGEAEYQFIIHKLGDASNIRIHYIGALKTSLKRGVVQLSTVHGTINEHIPQSYLSESKKELNVTFMKTAKDVYGYSVPNYSPNETLVIDPTPSLEWSTYFGGNKWDYCSSIATDKNNNIIVAGSTNSSTAIATSGAHQIGFIGTYPLYSDAFIASFTHKGTLRWGTYYGGSYNDDLSNLAVDTTGTIFVVGTTMSDTGIATTGAHQVGKIGTKSSYNAFIASFSTSGVRRWATYYGGKVGETGSSGIGIAVSVNGNILVTGTTTQSDIISTSGAHQQAFAGGSDAFVVSFSNSGVRQWGTFYGGTLADWVTSITTDKIGNVYISGSTNSTNGISSGGTVHQPTKNGGRDAFVAKFTSSGTLIWGTYYGGEADENSVEYGWWSNNSYGYSGYGASGISVDGNGSIFITGSTQSKTLIATSNGWQTKYGGDSTIVYVDTLLVMDKGDAFLAKFSSNGLLLWGTYYGGSTNEHANSLTLDKFGNVYVVGTTYSSSSLFASSDAYQIKNNGNIDVFIAKFFSDGVRHWATYFGGESFEFGSGIAVDGNLNVLVIGWTNSTTNIATVGTHQTILDGLSDGFITRWKQCTNLNSNITSNKQSSICLSDGLGAEYSLPFISGSTYQWQNIRLGTITSQSTTDSSITVNWTKVGTDTVRVRQTIPTTGCSKDTSFIVTIVPTVAINLGADLTVCLGESIAIGKAAIGGTPPLSYSWSPSIGILGSDTLPKITVSPATTTEYMVLVTDKNGCSSKDTIRVTVNPKPKVFAGNDTVICAGSSIIIGNVATSGSGGYRYNWTPFIGLSTDNIAQPTAKPLTDTTYQVVVTDKNGCTDTSKIQIRLFSSGINVKPDSVVFAEMFGCDPPKDTMFIIENTSATDKVISSIVSTDQQFKILTTLPITIGTNSSTQIQVRYDPNVNGTATGSFKITTAPCNGIKTVALRGSKQGVSFSVPDTLDAGEIISCQKTNTTIPLAIMNTSGGGVSGSISAVSMGKIVKSTISAGAILPNSVSQTYDATVTPTQDGKFLDSIKITFLPCDIVKTIYVKGQRTTVGLTADNATINMGKVQVGTSSSVDVSFINIGSTALTITDVPALALPFLIESITPPLPAILQTNEKLTVKVIYTAENGIHSAKVVAIGTVPCRATDSSFIQGEGTLSSGTSLSITKQLNFDSVCVGIPKILSSRITNNGTATIQVQQIIVQNTNAGFAVKNFIAQPLASGNKMDISIEFTPQSVGNQSTQIMVVTDVRTDSCVVVGIGKTCSNSPDSARTTVRLADAEGEAGEKVSIALVLKNEHGLSQSGAKKFSARIGLRRTILAITDQNYKCLNGTLSNRCEVDVAGEWKGKDTLFILRTTAALGDVENAVLELIDFEWIDAQSKVSVTKENGEFRLLNICKEGGVRLYKESPPISLSITPNPMNGNGEIEYVLPQESEIKVVVEDMIGREVLVIENDKKAAGMHKQSIDISNIGAGIYFVRLHCQYAIKMVWMSIIK